MKRFAMSLLLTAVSMLPCAAQYNLKIVDCPGAVITRMNGINNSGLIVGGFRLPGSPQHAMIYRDGVCEDLSPLLGSGFSAALGVNGSGDIVGRHDGRGFLLRNGVVTTFEFPGAIDTSASAINDLGLVIGQYTQPDGVVKGYRVDDTGALVPFALGFPGEVNMLPGGINNRGEMVGDWDDGTLVLGHGWLLKKRGPAISFDLSIAPTNGTLATGINDRGEIVGYFGQIGSTVRGFAWLEDGVVTIDSPTPAINILPNAINSKRVVVGGLRDEAGAHGFIATPVK